MAGHARNIAACCAAALLATAPQAEGFRENFRRFDEGAWHRAHYRFTHPHFDTDWHQELAQTGDGLRLMLRPQTAENRFLAASVRREEVSHFGRYEAVLTAARGPGLITGFFLFTGPAYGTEHDEIDWEFFGQDTTTAQVAWWKSGALRHKRIDLGFDAAAGPNRYAIDWQPDRIRWYANGTLVHEAREGIPTTPQRLFTNLWAVDPALQGWAGMAPDGLMAEAKADLLSFTPAGN